MDRATDTSDREIVLSRSFAAPRDLVFSVWTDPQHVGTWWGPSGFTTTIHTMDVRPGGMWTYTMHGPDGTDYENWVRYLVVERPSRLIYDHGGGGKTSHMLFQVTVDFVATPDGTTVTMRMVFPTVAARDEVVQRYGAIEGGKQHLARLGEHLTATQAGAPLRAHARFARRFAAPRDLVFQAWTDPAHLAHWWGPHGFTSPVCTFEARAGGRIRIDMRAPDGGIYPMTGEVRAFDPPNRLAFIAYPEDGHGVRMFEVLNTVNFAEDGDGTMMTVDTEVTALSAAPIPFEGMQVGWSQSVGRLDDLLNDPVAARQPERDIVTVRLILAPRERVYAAWTDPGQMQRWWGPAGFSNTFHVFDLRPGGDWRFTMHGPDGTSYPNHCVFAAIRPGEQLIIDHIGEMHAFQILAGFYDCAGGTLVRFRMRFDDAAECAKVRTFAASANEENMDRLEAVLGLR
jgi:uncharacterized protein YndB with AHSA1/START domain